MQEAGRSTPPSSSAFAMRPTREIRSETEITETDSSVSFRRVILWGAVAIALVIGVVLYFKYERLLAPLLG